MGCNSIGGISAMVAVGNLLPPLVLSCLQAHSSHEIVSGMKAAITLLLCVACPTLAWAGQAAPGNTKRGSDAKVTQTSALNRHDVSYAIGYRFGSEFADGDPAVDIATLVQAVKDAYKHRSPRVPAHTMREQLHTLGQQMHQRALASFRKLARSNASKSAEFMRENAQKSGVVTL